MFCRSCKSVLSRIPAVITGIILLGFVAANVQASISASNETASSVTLTWTAVGDDGTTGTATYYDVRYATFPITDANWDAVSQAVGEPVPQPVGTPETFTVESLESGTLYYFAIKVGDEIPNWSTLSNVVSKSTLDETEPPAVIADLDGSSPDPTSVALSWTAPGDDGTSGTAAEYDIRYALVPITDANWDAATEVSGEPTPQAAGSAESFTVGSLGPNTTYYFAIKTADEVPNWSGLSNVASVTTLNEQTAPGVIADLATSSPTQTSLTLTWTAPGDDGYSGTASLYDIRYATFAITDANWNLATHAGGEPTPGTAGSAETFTISSLNPSATYYFAIRTADEVPNWSGLSNVAQGTTSVETAAPAAIANLGAGNETEHTMRLTWTAPGDDANSGTASQYDIRYATAPITEATWDAASQVSDEPTPRAAGSLESYTVTGLNSGTMYYFAVKTADEVPNWSPLSNVTSRATASDQTPPAGIDDLQASTGGTEGEILLGWTAPGDNDNDGAVMGYLIKYATWPIDEQSFDAAAFCDSFPIPLAAGQAQSMKLSGLNPGQLYHVAVKSFDNAANLSPISNPASAVAGFNIVAGTEDPAALVSPPPGAVMPMSRPTLTIENVSLEADELYHFEVAADSTFFELAAGDSVEEQEGPTSSWKVNSRLAADVTYFWRVGTDDGGYSEVSTFTVLPQPHPYPNPFALTDGDAVTFTDLPVNTNLVVTTVSGDIVRQWSSLGGDDVIWDGTNESGHEIGSGMYLWFVADAGLKGKLMVVR
ncbi:MAG TPA: fibronectin type III domain-containing protein [Acidobacteriota bacterium]|nr:fibronectin type III domain-containing protein [Acidobacteriota bacterium]